VSKNKQLIVIQGPTASGKTALSIALAKKLKCAILSADSRQFYREISIGTAKPTLEERDGIPHFFIDSHSILTPVSAAQFEKEALAILEQEFQHNDYCIVVGGSGLFIDALCDGLDPLPSDLETQQKWQNLLEKEGLIALQQELKKQDPDYAKTVDMQNPHRLLRALEIISLTGKTMAEVRTNSKAKRPFAIHRYVVNLPREELYERINLRVLEMMKTGLLEEVKSVMIHRDLKSLNTVGYQELFSHIAGETTLENAIAMIQQNSRRYAKRQLTWFRRNEENHWLNGKTTEERLAEILLQFNA